MIDIADAGCPEGTSVIVRDIFFNTPARLKFMKKDLVERELIAKVLEKLAMSHPEISFSFIKDGQHDLQTSGDGNFKNVLYRIYGKEVFDSLLDTDYEYNGISVCGYVSKPVYARHNKGMQQYFLNHRTISLKTASYALDEAYRDSIMVKRYPAAFLHITIDPSEVDVNVHPSKQEVKFGNEKQIYDAVFYAVKSALNADIQRPVADRAVMTPALRESRINTPFGTARINSPASCDQSQKEEFANLVLKDVFHIEYNQKETLTQTPSAQRTTDSVLKQGDYISFNHAAQNDLKALNDAFPTEIRSSVESEFRIVGEIFDTYIIVEKGQEIYLVDKHAAHERFIYESIKGTFNDAASQLLMEPVVVTLTRDETAVFLKNREYLSEAGFLTEEFGDNTVIVREVPINLDQEDIRDVLCEILGELSRNRNEVRLEIMDKIIATVACKAAVKAGQKSTAQEMFYMIQKLLENTDIKYCPHGRPVAVVLTKYGIEKQFGRIV
ncbi:DNA mismatch repair protein MutL [bioreactor metagenome]|uniref:DNA mismatch repair protein MutL n=1 Tax=bioreactor metagenome TaxID=1076179 RepID=A0A645BLX6_9ZZZZ